MDAYHAPFSNFFSDCMHNALSHIFCIYTYTVLINVVASEYAAQVLIREINTMYGFAA